MTRNGYELRANRFNAWGDDWAELETGQAVRRCRVCDFSAIEPAA